MDNLSLFFLDVWTFAFSQVGILAIGFLGGYLWGAKVKAKVDTVIEK